MTARRVRPASGPTSSRAIASAASRAACARSASAAAVSGSTDVGSGAVRSRAAMPSSCSRYAVRSTSTGGTGPGVVTAVTSRRTRSSTSSTVASVTADHCSGWAHRWSPSAAELPSTASRRWREGPGLPSAEVTGPRRPGSTRDGLHEPHEPQQGAVGVADLGERRRQPVRLDVLAAVDEGGERRVLKQAHGPGRVREPEPGDGDRDRPRPARAHQWPPVTVGAGSARARRGSPGCGSRPTRCACCAGRTRRCARPASQRPARCPP